MADMDDMVITPPKIIAGAIYETTRNESPEQAVCLGRIVEGGNVFGLFRRVGLAFERYIEGSDEMVPWTLIWAPDGSHKASAETGDRISERTGKPVRPYNKR